MSKEVITDDRSAFDGLPLEQMVLVNQYCDQFELLWQESTDASLSTFVNAMQNIDAITTPILHGELVALDIQYRRQFGHEISIADYLSQYPALQREDLEQQIDRTDGVSRLSASKPLLDTGKRIGDYVIKECIGQGGMGQVYRARHELMGREVAIKVLLERVGADPIAQRRFEREVRWVAKMSHPNIVTAYDARLSDGMLCLVTEWIDGQDLAAVVADNGSLAVAEALDYSTQAAAGLDYAHGLGYIHRDVKPGNLLLDRNGNVKLLDLGLAKLRMGFEDEGSPETLTKSIQIVGTAAYLSPEQARAPEKVDVRSDIYSLGCTLFFLLTGKPPYSGSTPLDTLLSHVNRETPAVTDWLDENQVPDRLNELVASMMAKSPSDRPPSMNAVATQLAEIQASLRPDANPATPSRSARQPNRQLLRRSTVAFLLASATALLVLLVPNFSTWFHSPNLSPEPAPEIARGIAFDGESSYASVTEFDVPMKGPAMIEVLVTPRQGTLPANVVTWSGEQILVLFAGFKYQWGVALLSGGESHLEIAVEPFVYGRPYLLAASWDGTSLQLCVDGRRVQTRREPYPLFPSEPALCFGGIPDGLLPSDQGTRFFNGVIQTIRVSQGPLPDFATTASELMQQDASTMALFEMKEGQGNVTVDSTNNRWQATLINPAWER